MNPTGKCVLELDMQRNVIGGSTDALLAAIKKGADLRIYTEFRHNEHIDTSSDNKQLIREVSDFPATYVIDDKWVAGIMTLRQPVSLPDRFGPRPSMSFFMYNQDGLQAIARPYLDGNGFLETEGCPPPELFNGGGEEKPMIHMHMINTVDENTNAPASNFIYDFYSYIYFVQDSWEEVLSHDENGNVLFGNAKLLEEASASGCDIKVAISGISNGLTESESPFSHEIFLQTGSHYYYTEAGFMVVQTRPFARVAPDIPMTYKSHNWDFGQAIVRSDGCVAGLYYDPYTLKYRRTYTKNAVRWFVK